MINCEKIIENFDEITEQLLKPVSGSHPAGESIRYGAVYDEIITAMKSDNPALKQGIWQKTLKRADWRKTITLCVNALDEAKDFQVAVWLVQALSREHGFKGFNYGLKLLLLLTKKYWAYVFPGPDEIEIKLAPYFWLDEKFYYQLKFIPLTAGLNENSYTYESWEKINIKNKLSKENYIDHISDYLKHVSPNSFEFHKSVKGDISGSLTSLTEFKEFFRSLGKGYYPHFLNLEDMLNKINDINLIAFKSLDKKDTVAVMPPAFEEEVFIEEDYLNDIIEYRNENNNREFITSIEDAYKVISIAADYLIKFEPEYPTGFLIQNAVCLRSKIIE